MRGLGNTLSVSAASGHTKWLNALLARLYLNMHRSDRLQEMITNKLNRKFARLRTPQQVVRALQARASHERE